VEQNARSTNSSSRADIQNFFKPEALRIRDSPEKTDFDVGFTLFGVFDHE